jgi:hypothetical protein
VPILGTLALYNRNRKAEEAASPLIKECSAPPTGGLLQLILEVHMFKIFWIATIIYTIVFSVAARVNVPTCRLTRAQFTRVCNRFKFFSALPFFFSSAVFIICIFIMKSNSTSENFDRLIYSFCFWWITLATTPICLVNANAYLLRLEQLKKLI